VLAFARWRDPLDRRARRARRRISAGELFGFRVLAVLVAGAVGAVSEVIADLQRAAGATERLMELLATEPSYPRAGHPQPCPNPRGEVRFERVGFHYTCGRTRRALDFSLSVSRGEKVALVGPSGAANHVFQLLLRYYDPDAGAITLGPASSWKKPTPRRCASASRWCRRTGDLAASVAETCATAARRERATARWRAACEAAYATEFIERLPEGMNSFSESAACAFRAASASACRSRGAARRPRGAAPRTRRRARSTPKAKATCRKALEHLMRGRTTLVVAHRLATVKNADASSSWTRRGSPPARTPSWCANGGFIRVSRRCMFSAKSRAAVQ